MPHAPMPALFLPLWAAILIGYILTAEVVKHRFHAGLHHTEATEARPTSMATMVQYSLKVMIP